MNPKIIKFCSWASIAILLITVVMLMVDDIRADPQTPVSTVIIVSKDMYDIKTKADAYVRQGYKIKLIECQSIASGMNNTYRGEIILVLEK